MRDQSGHPGLRDHRRSRLHPPTPHGRGRSIHDQYLESHHGDHRHHLVGHVAVVTVTLYPGVWVLDAPGAVARRRGRWGAGP